MRALLARLADEADVVVVDTPPMLVVSDAIPLIGQASGVVVVARLGRTTSDAIRRLRDVIANTGGVLLGVVATGSKAGELSGYEVYEPMADEVVPNGHGPATAPPPRARRRFGVLRARR
jgi:non-specific protein-tyrosine kinase